MCFPAWEFFNGKHPFHRAVAGLSRGCLARGGHSVSGVTPTEDPQVFLATSRPGETPVSSGVGLALFDEQQRQIIPNETTVSRLTIDTRELAFISAPVIGLFPNTLYQAVFSRMSGSR
jgi:hypothetical protein